MTNSINPYIPITDAFSLWPQPAKDTYQFLQGFWHIGNKSYIVVDHTNSVKILKEEEKKTTWKTVAFKAVCVATLIIPLLSALIVLSHLATHRFYYQIQAKEDDETRFPTLKKDAGELVKLCNQMVDHQNPKELAKQLQTQITAFEGMHNVHLKKAHFKAIQAYQRVKETLRFVLTFKPDVFVDPSFTIKVDNDGNCLYHALALGLKKAKNIEVDHATLRKKAVDWMKANKDSDSILKGHFKDAIDDTKKAATFKYGQELASLETIREMGMDVEGQMTSLKDGHEKILKLDVDKYLEQAGKNAFFGTRAEIYAISTIYEVSVKIFRIYNGKPIDFQEVVNPQFSQQTIALQHENGNHFNLRTE